MPPHDLAARKRAQRTGRQKGCRVYIPEDVLREIGIDPDGPAPEFQLWPGRKGRDKGTVLVSLYGRAS